MTGEIQIPDLTGIKRIEFEVQLGDADYQIVLQWSDTCLMWFMDCKTFDGLPVFVARPMAANIIIEPPLPYTWRMLLLSSDGTEPNQSNFGAGKLCTLYVVG